MNPLVKVSIRFGLLAGFLGCILIFGLYYLGPHPFLIPVYMDFRIILFAVFIFFSLREIRDHYQNGVFYFWQGILSSFLFTITYAVLSSVLLVIFMRIDSTFLSDYIRLSLQQLKALPPEVIESIGKDVYDRNLELLPATSASDLAVLYFSQCLMISLFLSIILSVILRTHPKT